MKKESKIIIVVAIMLILGLMLLIQPNLNTTFTPAVLTTPVTIKTSPSDCTVTISGTGFIGATKSSGTTGALFYLPSLKAYTATVTKTGYVGKAPSVFTLGSAPISITVTLVATTPSVPVKYTLTVKTDPMSCTVTAGGTSKTSSLGSAIFSLASGTYSVVVSKTGYTTKTISVPLIAPVTTTVALSVVVPSYTLTVKTLPVSCTVQVSTYTDNSQLLGAKFTLPKASYTVTTSKTGYTTKTQTVSLDSNTNILVTLAKIATTPPPTTPPPTPEQVTCYQCQGGNVVSQLFTGSCGSGWFIDPPDCYTPPALPQYYKLQVTVTDAATFNTIPSVLVYAGGNPAYTGAATGIATFTSLPDGSYDITATKAGYQITTGTATISGSDGSTELQMTPLAPLNYNIILTVMGGSSIPVSDASVTVGSNPPQMTDLQGKVTFSSISPGTYSISITKSGYTAGTDSVVVSSVDVTKTIYLTPTTSGSYTLTVFTATDASVTLTQNYAITSINPTGVQSTISSGPSGVATFTNLPAGTYSLVIKKDGYTEKSETVTITSDKAVTAPLAVLPTPPKAIPGFEIPAFIVAFGIIVLIWRRKPRGNNEAR